MAVHRDEYPVAWQLPEEDEQYPGPGAWRGDAPDDSKEPLAASGRLFLVANRQNRAVKQDCSFRLSGKLPELWGKVLV